VSLQSKAAVAVWLGALVLSGLMLSRMSMTTDMTALLPQTADRLQQLLVSQLRDGVAARLLLIAIEGAPAEELARISRSMAAKLRAGGLFNLVTNGDLADATAEREMLMRHRYVLSPRVTKEHFEPAALRASLEERLRFLGSPAGAVTKAWLPSDPTGELLTILARMAPAEPPAMLHGVWFSRDGRRAHLIAESRAAGFDLDAQAAALSAVRDAFQQAAPPAGASYLVSGPAVFAVEARETIESDSWRLSLIAGALVVGLLSVVYRSVPLTLASLLPVLSGMAVGVAAVQLLFGFVHGITLGFGATLIGEAVDYPAYVFTHLSSGERLPDTVRRIWPTLRLAVLTTVFGALTLLLSSFTGLSQLGTLTVTGVIVAGLVTRWIVPVVTPPPASPPIEHVPFFRAGRLLASLRRGRWMLYPMLAGTVIVLVVQSHQLWDDDLANLSPVSQSAKQLDEQMRKETGAPDVRYLVVLTGQSREEVLTRSEEAESLLKRLQEDELIAGFELPSFYFPSATTQARRREALPEPAVLKAALAQAAADLPFRAGLFQPFLDDVERARTGPLLSEEDLMASALGLKLRALLMHQGNTWTALAPLRGVSAPQTLASRLADEGKHLWFVDLKEEAGRMVANYRHEAMRLTAAGVAAIALILWVGLRGLQPAWKVLAPPLFAIAVTVACFTLVGERLSLFHLVSLLLVLGIGLNYALFFHRVSPDSDESRQTSLALGLCIFATLSAFGTLASSRTPVLHAIGLTVTVGAFLSLLFSALLIEREAVSS
jgi:predicted exporter